MTDDLARGLAARDGVTLTSTTALVERIGRLEAENQRLSVIQRDVWEWINASFEPRNRPQSFALKAREEIKELIESGDVVEAADVVICMLAYCGYHGVSLLGLIEDKMGINWERTRRGEWVQDEQGVASRPATTPDGGGHD